MFIAKSSCAADSVVAVKGLYVFSENCISVFPLSTKNTPGLSTSIHLDSSYPSTFDICITFIIQLYRKPHWTRHLHFTAIYFKNIKNHLDPFYPGRNIFLCWFCHWGHRCWLSDLSQCHLSFVDQTPLSIQSRGCCYFILWMSTHDHLS